MTYFNVFRCKPDDLNFSAAVLANQKLKRASHEEGTPTTNGGTQMTKSNSVNSFEEEEIAPFEPVPSILKRDCVNSPKQSSF
jgi:hypothetical protein